MTIYLPKFSHNFQLAAVCFFTSCPKLQYNYHIMVYPSAAKLGLVPVLLIGDINTLHQFLQSAYHILTWRHRDQVSCCQMSAEKFLLPKDPGLFITSSILFGKLSGKKSHKKTSHHASGLKHLQDSLSPFFSTFLCCFKFKLSKASEHTVKLLLKRFCLPCVSQTLYSISDSFHVGVFAKLFGSPSLWLTSPLSPCYFYPPCQG